MINSVPKGHLTICWDFNAKTGSAHKVVRRYGKGEANESGLNRNMLKWNIPEEHHIWTQDFTLFHMDVPVELKWTIRQTSGETRIEVISTT